MNCPFLPFAHLFVKILVFFMNCESFIFLKNIPLTYTLIFYVNFLFKIYFFLIVKKMDCPAKKKKKKSDTIENHKESKNPLHS